MSGAATFQRASSNRKLATIERVPYPHKAFKFRPTPRAPFCCSTFVSIESTCSNGCAFKRGPDGEPGGCYVDSDSFMRRAMIKLDAAGRSAAQAIDDEIALLDSAFTRKRASNPDAPRIPQDGARGGRDLRLHVGGDVPDAASARKLAQAAARWLARGGGRVWTFTHGWAEISRAAFGKISVLASIEREHQVSAAAAQGFAPALVVAKFPRGKRPFNWGGVIVRALPGGDARQDLRQLQALPRRRRPEEARPGDRLRGAWPGSRCSCGRTGAAHGAEGCGMKHLRLCRADGLIRGSIRPCLAFASRCGYCWAHWKMLRRTWGAHFWWPQLHEHVERAA